MGGVLRGRAAAVSAAAAAILVASSTLLLAEAGSVEMRLAFTGSIAGNVPEFSIFRVGTYGGMSRVKSVLDEVAAEAEAAGQVLLKVDTGNTLGTNVFDQYYKGSKTSELMNSIGFEATGVGLTTFYQGLDEAANHLRSFDFPTVCTNLQITDWHPLSSLCRRYVTVNFPDTDGGGGNTTFGILGLQGKFMCSRTLCDDAGVQVEVLDPVTSLRTAVAELQAMGVDSIICMLGSSVPLAFDGDPENDNVESLIADVDGIDVWLGARSRYVQSNDGRQVDSAPVGPFPMEYTGPTGAQVLLFGIDEGTRMVGNASVTWTDGAVTAWSGNPAILASCSNDDAPPCVVPDAAVQAKVDLYEQAVHNFKNNPIGQLTEAMAWGRPLCRFEECEPNNLVVDAIMWKMEGLCDLAVMNAGAVHAGLDAGTVTMGALLALHPFQNTIATFGLRGAIINDMLINSVSKVPPNNTMAAYEEADDLGGAGRFLAVAGMRFSFDPTKPLTQRIVSREVFEGGEWRPMSLNREYTVCATNFLRHGGDDYDMLSTEAIDPNDFGPTLSIALAEYVRASTPIAPPARGRVTRVVVDGAVVTCTQGCVEGTCVDWDSCSCNSGWLGVSCNETQFVNVVVDDGNGNGATIGGAVAGALVFVFVVVFLVVRAKMRKSLESKYTKVIDYDEIDIGDELGRGTYGIIYWGKWRGVSVAVKQIRVEGKDSVLLVGGGGGSGAGNASANGSGSGSGSGDQPQQELTEEEAELATVAATAHQKTALGAITKHLKVNSEATGAFHEEIAVMCSLRHPNVVLYMGSTKSPLCIVTEFMQRGSLQDNLFGETIELPWWRRVSLSLDAALGMRYLHEHSPQLLHCDLKAANILVDVHWTAKVCDFGLSAHIGDFNPRAVVGTFLYMAPEVGNGAFTAKSDVFSFAIVMVEIVNRLAPYIEILKDGVTSVQIVKRVFAEQLRPVVHYFVEEEYRQLMLRCWAPKPEDRPSFREICTSLEHMKETWAKPPADEKVIRADDHVSQLERAKKQARMESDQMVAELKSALKKMQEENRRLQGLLAKEGGRSPSVRASVQAVERFIADQEAVAGDEGGEAATDSDLQVFHA